MPPKIDPGGRGEPPDRLPRATSAKTTFIFGLLPGSKNASKSKLEFEVIFERFSRPGEARHGQARPGTARDGFAQSCPPSNSPSGIIPFGESSPSGKGISP